MFHLSRRRTCLLLVLLALSSTALLFPPSLRRPKSPSLPPQAPSPPSFLSIPGPLVRDESLPSEIYQQFATPPPPSRRSSDQGVLPVPMLGPACLTSWIAEGVLGDGCTVDGAAGVDFVWTWLNGSDVSLHLPHPACRPRAEPAILPLLLFLARSLAGKTSRRSTPSSRSSDESKRRQLDTIATTANFRLPCGASLLHSQPSHTIKIKCGFTSFWETGWTMGSSLVRGQPG